MGISVGSAGCRRPRGTEDPPHPPRPAVGDRRTGSGPARGRGERGEDRANSARMPRCADRCGPKDDGAAHERQRSGPGPVWREESVDPAHAAGVRAGPGCAELSPKPAAHAAGQTLGGIGPHPARASQRRAISSRTWTSRGAMSACRVRGSESPRAAFGNRTDGAGGDHATAAMPRLEIETPIGPVGASPLRSNDASGCGRAGAIGAYSVLPGARGAPKSTWWLG